MYQQSSESERINSESSQHAIPVRRRRISLGSQAVPADQWKHMHRVTIVHDACTFWWMIGVVVFVVAQNLIEQGNIHELRRAAAAVGSVPAFIFILVALGVLLVTILAVLLGIVTWKHTTYALARSGVHLRSGVFFKRHTQIAWERIQSVEIQQSLFARIVGFGTVKVESAGQEKDCQLGLLSMREAAQLRRSILQYVNAARSAHASQLPEEMIEPQGAAEELVLDVDDLERDGLVYVLPTRRYLLSRLLSTTMMFTLLYCVAVIVSTLVAAFVFDAGIKALPGLGTLAVAAGMVWAVFTGALHDFGTKIYISPLGIRRRAGATKIYTVNYPPERIHAIQIRRPWLCRLCGWWEMRILKAGIAGAADQEELSQVFIPVATREEILRVLWILMPGLGTDHDADILAEAMDGTGTHTWFIGSPRSARWASPLGWKGNGVYVAPKALITRSGRFSRTVAFVPHDHIQSLHMKQGPLARWCGLAHLHADCVPGVISVAARELDVQVCQKIFYQENDTARHARHVGVSESLAQWKERNGLNDE